MLYFFINCDFRNRYIPLVHARFWCNITLAQIFTITFLFWSSFRDVSFTQVSCERGRVLHVIESHQNYKLSRRILNMQIRYHYEVSMNSYWILSEKNTAYSPLFWHLIVSCDNCRRIIKNTEVKGYIHKEQVKGYIYLLKLINYFAVKTYLQATMWYKPKKNFNWIKKIIWLPRYCNFCISNESYADNT